MKVLVVRLGQLLAISARLVERGRYLGNAIALRQRRPAAGNQLFREQRLLLQRRRLLRRFRFPFRLLGCLPGHRIASGHNGGLDLAAALHQLLKDAVEFIEVGVAGDEGLRLEAPSRNQIQRACGRWPACDGRWSAG